MMSATVQDQRRPQAGRRRSVSAKRDGYVVSSVINAVLIYLLDAHPGWRAVPFLRLATSQVTGLFTVALAAGIAANLLYFIAVPRRLRAFGDLVTLTISLVTAVRIWQVFPFAFHGSMAFCTVLVRILLIIGIVGAYIGLVYSLVVLVRGKPGLDAQLQQAPAMNRRRLP